MIEIAKARGLKVHVHKVGSTVPKRQQEFAARGDIAPTCVAHYAKDVSTRLVADRRFPNGVRPYTVREYARLQGVPDSFTFAGSDSDAYRQIGNGVSVPVGEWLGREFCRYFAE